MATYMQTLFDAIPAGASVPLRDLYAVLPIATVSVRSALARCVEAGALVCRVDPSLQAGPDAVTYTRAPDAACPADGRGHRR